MGTCGEHLVLEMQTISADSVGCNWITSENGLPPMQNYGWGWWCLQGETGANASKGPFGDPEKAIADFKKKFKDKTRNDWDKRDNFSPVPGKYTMIEMDTEEDEEKDAEKVSGMLKERWQQTFSCHQFGWQAWHSCGSHLLPDIGVLCYSCWCSCTFQQMKKLDEIDGAHVKRIYDDCTLDKATQNLVKLIFDNDMFKEAMAQMEIGEIILALLC